MTSKSNIYWVFKTAIWDRLIYVILN